MRCDHELRDLKDRCDADGCEVLSIILDGEDAVLHARFIKRLSENRHPVHKSQDFSRIEDFKEEWKEILSIYQFVTRKEETNG